MDKVRRVGRVLRSVVDVLSIVIVGTALAVVGIAILSGTSARKFPGLTSVASEAGVHDTAAFGLCMTGPSAWEVVRRDSTVGWQLGLRRVPGVLLDSMLFAGSPNLRYLREYVRQESKRWGEKND